MRSPKLYLQNLQFINSDDVVGQYTIVRQYFHSFDPDTSIKPEYKEFLGNLTEVADYAYNKAKGYDMDQLTRQQAWAWFQIYVSLWVRSLKDKLGLRADVPSALPEDY